MKIAINWLQDDDYEIGYKDGYKLIYKKMKEKALLKFVKSNDVIEVAVNNATSNLLEELEEIVEIKETYYDSVKLRCLYYVNKLKIERLVFIDLGETMTWYYHNSYEHRNVREVDTIRNQRFGSGYFCENLELNMYYRSKVTYRRTILERGKLTLENIYHAYAVRDKVGEFLYDKVSEDIVEHINKFKNYFATETFVIRTNFSKNPRIYYFDDARLDLDVVVPIDWPNKRDNVRVLLNSIGVHFV